MGPRRLSAGPAGGRHDVAVARARVARAVVMHAQTETRDVFVTFHQQAEQGLGAVAMEFR